MVHRTTTGNVTWRSSLRVDDIWWRAIADTGSILITPNWSLRLSAKWSLLPEMRRGCCFVPLEDERAAQTIGAVTSAQATPHTVPDNDKLFHGHNPSLRKSALAIRTSFDGFSHGSS